MTRGKLGVLGAVLVAAVGAAGCSDGTGGAVGESGGATEGTSEGPGVSGDATGTDASSGEGTSGESDSDPGAPSGTSTSGGDGTSGSTGPGTSTTGSGGSGGAGSSSSGSTTSGGPNSVCGDGVVEGDEECDDGNANNSDDCLDTCVAPSCGDGFVQAGEECDDGNLDNNDACLATCVTNVCGDGFQNPSVEACDDGNNDDCDGCPNTCRISHPCGNGSIDCFEPCDDGNDDNTDGCTNYCEPASCGDGHARRCDSETFSRVPSGTLLDEVCCATNALNPDGTCADGVQEDWEQCDDGEQTDENSCTNGCRWNLCGDGIPYMEPSDEGHPSFPFTGEECDDGNADDTDACTNLCRQAICGDGIVQPGQGEACDEGANNTDVGACRSDCQLPTCGDGFVREDISDPNAPGYEACDDGNADQDDACLNDCTLNTCGDGFLGPDEQCDAGAQNVAPGPGVQPDDCVAGTCAIGACGNGTTDTGLGEECDPADPAHAGGGCTPVCTLNVCGDGHVGGSETCDDGNAAEYDACKNDCTVNVCGDGVLRQRRAHDDVAAGPDRWPNTTGENPEACDDGNLDNTDGCLAIDLPGCGCGGVFYPSDPDGVLPMPGINCDPQPSVGCGGDGVLECVAARCGDGVTQVGVEDCDDGAPDDLDGDGFRDDVVRHRNWDGCITRRDPLTGHAFGSCAQNWCGDGLVWIGVEPCDDGNVDDLDLCTTVCLSNLCGAGAPRTSVCTDAEDPTCDFATDLIQDADAGMWEQCDDANGDDGDGCTQACIDSP